MWSKRGRATTPGTSTSGAASGRWPPQPSRTPCWSTSSSASSAGRRATPRARPRRPRAAIYRLSGPTTGAKPVIPPSAAPRAAKPLRGEEGAEVLADLLVGVRALHGLRESAERAVVAHDRRAEVLIPCEHRIDCLLLLVASDRESSRWVPFAPLEVSAASLADTMELAFREGYPRSAGRRRSGVTACEERAAQTRWRATAMTTSAARRAASAAAGTPPPPPGTTPQRSAPANRDAVTMPSATLRSLALRPTGSSTPSTTPMSTET